jgi:tRNA A-37 threonylcarbamoyl transferase component Bud32
MTTTTIDRLVRRAAEERWRTARLDAAINRARELRADAGKPCGASFIPREATCHKGVGALTPATLAKTPARGSGSSWRRKAAIAAGITATGLAVGLPAASFFQSGTAPGRRASMKVEGFAREASRGLMAWGGGALAPVGVPLGMGLGAAAEGMRAGRMARRTAESWRAAPGFASAASGLASRKSQSAAARESYINSMKSAWQAGTKPITPAEARRRANEVRKVEQQIADLTRQAATRSRAAGRAARIARTGAAFRSTPTPSEAWLREALQSDPITRTPASLTAGLLRGLQSTRRGLNARRPRFYGDAEDSNKGKPCGASHIPNGHKCHKGSSSDIPPAGPGLTPAKVLGAAAAAGVVAAGAYAWRKRDSVDLRAAMAERPISGERRRKPNRIEQLLAERRAQRCGRRGDALPLSATNPCAESTFAEVYVAKDGASIFKVPKEPDLPAAQREFAIQSAAFAAGVPTARPLTIHPRTGVIRMERLPGRTLEEVFGEEFDASHQPRLGLELSAAMRTMHRVGISHGDLHVGNVMETPKGLRLIDWGFGRRAKDGVIDELSDSRMAFGLGLSYTPEGRRAAHPALSGFASRVRRTADGLDALKPGSTAWRRLIDEHYDEVDAMFRQAAGA